MHWQDHRRPRKLPEVEVLAEISEQQVVLADVGPGVWAAVGGGIQPFAAEEVVLDELVVGIVAEYLMVDVAAARVRADDDSGHAEAEAVAIDGGGYHVVIEATPVVPCEEDRRARPVRALHDRVDEPGHICLTAAD